MEKETKGKEHGSPDRGGKTQKFLKLVGKTKSGGVSRLDLGDRI